MTLRPSSSLALTLGCVLAASPLVAAPRGTAPAHRTTGPAAAETLAVVDGAAITADDLVLRAGLMPWPRGHSRAGEDSARARALRAMVGERLLADAAARGAIAIDSARVARAAATLRGALARDALYRDVARGAAPAAAAVERALAARPRAATAAARRAQRRAVTDSLARLAGSARARTFLAGLLGGLRAAVNSTELLVLADTLRALESTRDTTAPDPGAGEFADALRARLAPRLGRTLVALPGAPFTVGDVIEALRFQPLAIRARTPRGFAAELSAKLRAVVEAEVATREALRRGYGSRAEVARELDTWVTTWRAQLAAAAAARGSSGTAARDAVDRAVASLATRARITVRPAALARARLPEADLVTRRRLGFGGSMLAAPPLPPLGNWPRASATPVPLP